MSSFPKELTFLESYKKTQTNEDEGHPSLKNIKKEIHYLEQEFNYWITENGVSPSETKEKRIQDLVVELNNVKEIYADFIKNNR